MVGKSVGIVRVESVKCENAFGQRDAMRYYIRP